MVEEQDDAEQTEDPTPRRLDQAIERGDVVKSIEVSTWFMIGGATLSLMIFSGPTAVSLQTAMRSLLAHSFEIPTDGASLVDLTWSLGGTLLVALGIPLLLLTVSAFAGTIIQHRIIFSFEPLKPGLSKISPIAGFMRLFSMVALANFVKGFAKLALFGTVIGALLWPARHIMGGLIEVDPALILPVARSLAVKLLGTVVAILAVVAAADYLFQYRQWYDRHKMSVREMKEEFRQTEGDPAVKGKIKQLRQSRARRRMMAKVPKASVVITNPTHFAVALQYERGMSAPVCVAKGADLIVRKIREVAEAHNIPIMENPPLARALHATVEIDQEIPQEHYRAVAEIIGYVMRLRGAFRR
ncbi:MAG: flagellar type III secretion system protein FlhB [Xanthobacteraceae bacterium]